MQITVQAKEWAKQYTSLVDVHSLYSRDKVTPHMHIMYTHVANFVRK
jgi:hypothetical protein